MSQESTPKNQTGKKGRNSKRKEQESSSNVSPSLKRQNSLPDIHSLEPSMNESILQAFRDSSFLKELTPIFSTLIERSMEAAIARYEKSIVEPLLASNNKLLSTIKHQEEVIMKQSVLIENQAKTISANSKRIQTLETDLNDLQQYGRRKSIRINNLPVPEEISTEGDLARHIVSFINNNILNPKPKPGNVGSATETTDDVITERDTSLKVPLDVDTESIEGSIEGSIQDEAISSKLILKSSDIETCHPVGLSKKQLIVKFMLPSVKHRVMAGKRNLKGNPDKVFITEDLTKFNYNLVKKLMSAKSSNLIHSYWTYNGNVYAKSSATQRQKRVLCQRDIDLLTGDLSGEDG